MEFNGGMGARIAQKQRRTHSTDGTVDGRARITVHGREVKKWLNRL